MSQKTNYFKLGIFVISAAAILLVAVFFFGAREMFRQEWLLETYFDTSVQGLDVGSPVKMMGVKIGAIKEISFVYQHYRTERPYIRVTLSVDPHALGLSSRLKAGELRESVRKEAEKGLRLAIASQGITGVMFLDASYYDPDKTGVLEIDWHPEYPYLPSVPGTLARLKSTLEKTLENVSRVDFAGISKKVDQVVSSLALLLKDDLNPMVREIRGEIKPALVNMRRATARAPEITSRFNLTLQSFYDLLSDQKGGLEEVGDNMRIISENLRQLTENARRDASQIIFGGPPPHSEVIRQP